MTPSDIDSVLDDNGLILFKEFSSHKIAWQGLEFGQRLLYCNILRACKGDAIAVLATHNTEPGQLIDTVKNVTSFHLMYWSEEGIVYPFAPIRSNKLWIEFVSNYSTNYMTLEGVRRLTE